MRFVGFVSSESSYQFPWAGCQAGFSFSKRFLVPVESEPNGPPFLVWDSFDK